MRPTLFRYKEQKMERIRKAAKATSVIVIAILTALTLTILCASEEERIEIAEMVDNLSDQEEPERQIDWDSLPAEVVAWIEVPGTSIDEPIAQAMPDAPNVYLYRDVFGQGAYGTPYIDCECTIDSRFVMVYGHHMSDGSVFAEFADFIDEGFARDHNRIIVYKRRGETLELEVCAVDIVNANKELVGTQFDSYAEMHDYVKSSIRNSDLVLIQPQRSDDLFWTFATCSYQTDNSRTVVYTLKI